VPAERAILRLLAEHIMKISSVTPLVLPDVKVIRFARFRDDRGYFTEPFRRSDFDQHGDLAFLARQAFVQVNESHSNPGVLRGLHFQWNPYMGKLVRTLSGHMVDIFLDIRKGSPTAGQAAMYDMPDRPDVDFSEWIWVPPGFAHGNFFPAETRIEYFCTGEYSPGFEAAISPLAPDIDWTKCDPALKTRLDGLRTNGRLTVSEKDRQGLAVGAWFADPRSDEFRLEALVAR
jgi:dTDP-4-dehydrorhamnose 3,5-epimerase